MGEGRYRLEPVRDARSRDERIRRGDLAAAVGDAKATEAKLEAATRQSTSIRQSLESARAALRDRLVTGSTSTTIAAAERHLSKLRRDLDAAIDAQLRAEANHRGQVEVIDAARLQLARARADKEVIERHFERWRDEKNKLAERRED